MPGSKTNTMSRQQVLAAVRAVPAKKDFVWNGKDEDVRPATQEELSAGVDAYRKAYPNIKPVELLSRMLSVRTNATF